MGDFISIYPSELKFPFELRRQSSCSMQLTNKTEKYVAFKVKTTNPKKYCVRPNSGVVLPGSSCNVTVTMQAQKEAPPEPCRDKFLIQSVIAPDGSTNKDITPETFHKEDGRVVKEFKMRVIYIPANPPSPVPEGSEEGTPPRASSLENGNQNFEEVSRSVEDTTEKSSEAWSTISAISKLTDEKASALQQNQRLRQELEMVRKDISKSRSGGFSLMFLVLVGILGVLIGYLVKRA
ncbi:hypothetical protein V6N11_012800 [Hibiscus sabdariffa]|uniref:MSP domain-containing protein n=2 Tax=Hibiscus sabdariffa TaxID=183260 RepID=A0ABR2BQZ8_9ROSI